MEYQILLKVREKYKNNTKEIYEEPPVGIREFLETPIYCPSPNQIRPAVKNILIEFFENNYKEALVIAGIGSGKSFLTSKAIEYITYQLLCFKNPQKVFNLSDDSSIYIINVSINREQAKKVVFGEIKNRIDQSPWFHHFHKPSDKIKSELRFDKNISIFPLGSNETAPLGYNIFSGIIDEASFHVRTKTKDYAEASYNQMAKRIKSRFMDKGKLFIITSPRFVYDFAEKKFEEDKNPRLLKKRIPVWEAIPKEQYCGRTFDLGEFFPEFKGKQIPIEYYNDFRKNPDLSMRDLGAVPSLALQGFFKDSSVLARNINKNRKTPVLPNGRLADWFKAQDKEERFIHIDLALGKEDGDVAGFAMGKFNGWLEITNEATGKIERRPKIYIDLMRTFEALPGKEIEFGNIREFIYGLQKRGFNIKKVSADSWQSKDTLQILHNAGLSTMTLSVDRNIEAYTYMKEGILENRMDYYLYPKFIKECRYLELIDGKKVDHPLNGCFTEETRVALVDGTNPTFKELSKRKEDFYVYSIGEDGLCIEKARNARVTKKAKELVELTLDNFQVIRCTPEHLFMTLQGDWVQAKNITPDISIMPLYRARIYKGVNSDYERVWCPIRNKRILTHHLSVGGCPRGYVVHHKNRIKWDNSPENLEIMGIKKHYKLHAQELWKVKESKMREGHLKYRQNKEAQKKHSERMKEKWANGDYGERRKECSIEGCKRISNARGLCDLHYQRARRAKIIQNRSSKQKNHKVIFVKKVKSNEDVYDLTVPKTGNFALASGVFVHNSKDVADAVAGVCWHCNKSVGGLGIIIAGGQAGTHTPEENTVLKK